MAEQEVVKHTEKVYKIWSKKEHSFWYKLKEFMIEILIIVFAVSLSIWFHERSEHSHQQAEVKAFLLGIRRDLQSDVHEMEEDKQAFENSRAVFTYLGSLKLNQKANADSVRKMRTWIFNQTRLVSNRGRYEGFKSAGKLGNIENTSIQNDVVNLFEEDIPNLMLSSDVYNNRKSQIASIYAKTNKRYTDSTTNELEVLSSPEVYNIANGLNDVSEITTRYDSCIVRAKRIISEIKKEYPKDPF